MFFMRCQSLYVMLLNYFYQFHRLSLCDYVSFLMYLFHCVKEMRDELSISLTELSLWIKHKWLQRKHSYYLQSSYRL